MIGERLYIICADEQLWLCVFFVSMYTKGEPFINIDTTSQTPVNIDARRIYNNLIDEQTH
jgi:hypothetical protein